MSARPQVLIIGGSVGGLIAAGLFRSIDWDVTVFERTVGDLAARGAGLGISAELLGVIKRIGARFEPSAGVARFSRVWMDGDGRIVFRIHRPSVGSTWVRIYQPLRDNVPPEIYRQGMNLLRVEDDAQSVTAVFTDGTRITGDLLVAADGVHSTVRKQFLPGVEPRYADYVAWRGIVEEAEVSRSTVASLGEDVVHCFPDRGMLLAMAVPGAGDDMRPGHRRIYFIWYKPVRREARDDLFTDASGVNHGVSIPPPLIRAELIRDMQAEAAELFAPPIADVVNRVTQPLLQAISDLESPRMTFGRVALMGDAAFVARPHTAAGVSKAALDAQCLADSIAAMDGDVTGALQAYHRSQHEFGSRLVAHSRALGASIEGSAVKPNPGPGDSRREREQLIRDYGAPQLLNDVDPTSV
jgi:2-polyprenyl-6-methoxyphenol hydroxylase-like FAD-dependent oxidoreductase